MLWISFMVAVLSRTVLCAQRQRNYRRDGGSVAPNDPNAYAYAICEESDQWSEPTRPCETLVAIDDQCITGVDFHHVSNQTGSGCYDEENCQSFEFERTCYCQSQFLDSVKGCYACYRDHGSDSYFRSVSYDMNALPSIMSDYCDATVDPTAAFGDYLQQAISIPVPVPSPKFNDPLGSSITDVSLYYTPSLTGAEAWKTELSTIVGWSSEAIEASEPSTSTSTSTIMLTTTMTRNSTSSSTNTSTSSPIRNSTSSVRSTSTTEDSTSNSASYTASTIFSTTANTPANTIPSTEYYTTYTSATDTDIKATDTEISVTSGPRLAQPSSASRNVLSSIISIIGILSFLIVVCLF